MMSGKSFYVHGIDLLGILAIIHRLEDAQTSSLLVVSSLRQIAAKRGQTVAS